MNTLAEIVLLETRLRIDAASVGILIVALGLYATLVVACRPSLRSSTAARIALAFVLIGALLQCLAGELLLFLTGGTLLGYAMLALGLAGPRALTPFHALAAAMLIVAGDLALLELVMLLAKSAPNLSYESTGAVFDKLAENSLARFCLVLGFGSRLALAALCVPEGRSSAANIATLPGWLLLGVSAMVGAIRLSCAGEFAGSCSAPLLEVLWWVPLLALAAWQLPRAIPGFLRGVKAVGTSAALLRDSAQATSRNLLQSAARQTPATILDLERRLALWPVAMGGLLILIMACALVLFLGGPLPATR